MEDPEQLLEAILIQVFGGSQVLVNYSLVAAGNLNQAIFLQTDKGAYFLKTNFQSNTDLFKKELEGLELIRSNCSLHVPEIIAEGTLEDTNFLLMDWISPAKKQTAYWEKLGEGLAELHMSTRSLFGLDTNNYISILDQSNQPTQDWVSFFIHQRLEPMLQRAFYENLIPQKYMEEFREIYPRLDGFFPNEKSSLLHGDLWSGNIMVNSSGLPSLIDPAVYFGHREMDLAFSKLFGGFDPRFYAAYDQVFPLEPGFDQRVAVYNLYPLLVHLNLFGTSYLSGISQTVKKLLN